MGEPRLGDGLVQDGLPPVGELYDAYESGLGRLRERCKDLCWQYNALRPLDADGHARLLAQIVGSMEGAAEVVAPFWCDYGANISLGDNFYCNHGMVALDAAPIRIGRNVFVGPGCRLCTSGHPEDAGLRAQGLEYALPIAIGNDVWIGANVTVCPGVTIGSDVVIGAGSVVSRDIPSHVVAVGVPCRPVRPVDGKRDARWGGPASL